MSYTVHSSRVKKLIIHVEEVAQFCSVSFGLVFVTLLLFKSFS